MKNKTKRPWQGILLGIIFSLLTVAIPVITTIGLSTFLASFIISQNAKIAANFLGVFPIVLGVSFVMVVLTTLITVGIFYGRRWSIGLILVGMILNFLNGIFTLLKSLSSFNIQYISLKILGLLVTSFIIWLSIVSLKHSFYGGDKTGIDWKSWKGIKNIFKKNKNTEDTTTF